MSNIITVAKQQPTIVTVPAKAVKQDLKTETNTIVYMPLASKLNPGVVQIGDGLIIDINGVLSFDENEVPILQIAKNGELIPPNENKIGDIILNKNDVGLTNVDNTSDMNKPVSIYQQQALDGKLDKFAGVPHSGKVLYVDTNGFITYRQLSQTFRTYNNGYLISNDTQSYNFSGLFDVSTSDGKEININGSEHLLNAFRTVEYNSKTGVLTFWTVNSQKVEVDLPLELIIQNGYYDSESQELVLVLANEETIKIPVADLVNVYYGDDTTIELKNIDNKLVFNLKDSSVTTNKIADYTVTDEKLVSISGSKVTGTVNEAVIAQLDINGNDISNTYRKINDSYNKTEIDDYLSNKADVSQLPVIIRLGGV